MIATTRPGPGGTSAVLAIGFGTTVAMWAVGYVTHLPPAIVSPPWVLILMLVCLAAGGYAAGRYTDGGWKIGLLAGLLAGALNLLVLGSLLAGDRPGAVVPSALLWVPGSFLVCALVAALGALVGARARAFDAAPDWTAAFARVAAIATFLLLIVGGLVTSQEAGLAVVDWPNTFGYNMFLYPLSRMTGGVYYEHAHRLFGSLVGLTTLVLAAHLLVVERRRWVKSLGVLALGLVIVQGILGGLRVTGRFTLSDSPEATSPSLALAVVHGVLGQVVLGVLVALAVVTSSRWKTGPPADRVSSAGLDRTLSVAFVSALLVQLILGALLRHLSAGLIVHITMACFVAVLGLAAGARAWGLNRERPLLERLGTVLLLLVPLQLLLGIGALVAVTGRDSSLPPPPADVSLSTAHQATGAVLLASAVMLALWTGRLVEPEE
jgi:cytochrome c oxidase assembly protein subunit 15